jgi:hypothetical protein
MIRHLLLVLAIVLSGCGDGDPVANDPMLILNVKRGNNESPGRYRVSHTGVITESGEGPTGGAVTTSETVTIDKIADDGVTLTISLLDSDGRKSSKQIHVPYDKEISVAVSKDVTATARLERGK